MKNLLLIILTLFLVNCGSKETESKKETVKTIKEQPREESRQNIDSSNCDCPKPFETAETQIKIDYENGKYLKFCSWDYNSNDSTTTEFRFYSQSDSIILEGNIPTQFKIVSIDRPVKLIQSTIMDIDNGERWKMTPIFNYRIGLTNGEFQVSDDFVFQPPAITKTKRDSILKEFQSQPKHHNQYDKFDPPFASEQQIMDLFICAVNGNEECILAHDSLQTRFVTDGAIGELYYELNGLLQIYKRERKNNQLPINRNMSGL
jgi:hypothetical protein